MNSAALLLGSASSRHPDGLANSSGLVGRNYMAHLATMMEAFHPFRVNPTEFQKTVALNDFYLAGPGARRSGTSSPRAARTRRSSRQVIPGLPRAARAGVDRPRPRLAGDDRGPAAPRQPGLADGLRAGSGSTYARNNVDVHKRLVREAVRMLRGLGYWGVVRHSFKDVNTTHQCGTAVFGDDPRTSVLDPMLRQRTTWRTSTSSTRSFFPSSAAVNPGLTIIAQSLRVADHLRRTVLAPSHALATQPSTTTLGEQP